MYYKGVSNKRDRAQALVSIHERLPHWTENKKDHMYAEMYSPASLVYLVETGIIIS
jgi:hypothetical protein